MKQVNIQPHDYRNLAELILDRSQILQNENIYTFLKDDLQYGGSLTYAQLQADVERLAAYLLSLAKPGDRVLLLYPSGIEYITAFFACLTAGLIAVPVYAVQSPKDHNRLNTIARDSGALLACTTRALFAATAAWREQLGSETLQVVCTDDLQDTGNFSLRDAVATWDEVAFLQYTSGSTGNPKGVMVTHGNLLHNASLIARGFGLERTDIGASWLPPYHDMGLIGGIVTPLFQAIPIYLLSPLSFLKRPQRWLQVVSQYGVTCTGGPNFAYDYCVKRITDKQSDELDLSRWSIAFNGAEPIRPESLTRFNRHFARAGFNAKAFMPCYGLAESTLFVSGAQRNQGAQYVTLKKEQLENQHNLADTQRTEEPSVDANQLSLVISGVVGVEACVIGDPATQQLLPAGNIGEIWVSSESVAKGYWQNPEATQSTFKLRPEGEQRFFMRTGDLGFLHQGELVVTGRIKELIIINGRNLYPQDIESCVQELDVRLQAGVTAVVSSADDINGTESLIVFQEVQRKDADPDTLAELGQRIRTGLLQQYQINPQAVVLLPTSTIPKTTSGKIQRRHTLELFHSNNLKTLWQAASSADLPGDDQSAAIPSIATKSTLRSPWAERIEIVLRKYLPAGIHIPSDRPFQELGLDSKSVMAVTADLEDMVGLELSPTLVFAYPTINDLAAYFDGDYQSVSEDIGRTSTDSSSVAITGIACRFPGAESPISYWKLLTDARCAIGEVPESRWDWQMHSERQNRPGYGQARYGGFITQIEQFDAEFFGISPKEARLMDPQQRLLLQETWHAFEDAGIAPHTLKGRRVGVYVGASESDYSRRVAQSAAAISPWVGTGSALSILANRISYIFGFHGPSMTVDTACSSSLTALHLAVQGLRSGDCDWAIVAGVNLITNPELNLIFSQAGMLAPDGLCKTFDESADGYVRAEGCGVVILRRTADCSADDRIYAEVVGTAVNQDGQSNGLTAPNLRAQVQVIERALAAANMHKSAVQAVECHGTGTELGDPIELSALDAVYRSHNQQLRIGSVKSNLGHLEAAAGMASLIKTALCIHHSTWVPSLHCSRPTSKFPWHQSPLRVQQNLEPAADPMIIGVSGFGFGGTNVHAILQAPAPVLSDDAMPDTALKFPLVTVSARHPESLNQLVADYRALLQHSNPAQVALASQLKRSHLSHRSAWRLDSEPGGSSIEINGSRPAVRLAWLFTGQGSQYQGMGREAYTAFPGYREVIDSCDAPFRAAHGFSLISLLWGEHSAQLNDTQFTQPALYAFEVAMARLWLSWGVQPDAFVGHSVGEYAAACLAGIFSVDAGMKLILARGQLMYRLCEPGSMLAIWQASARVTTLLRDFDDLNVAAFNSPDSQVVAGPVDSMQRLIAVLENLGINHKALSVSHSFHSASMKPMLDAFREVAESIQYAAPQRRIFSALSGAESGDMANADYWIRHVIEPVHFQKAVSTASANGINTWLEVGPGHTLCSLAKHVLNGERHHLFFASAQPNHDDGERLIDCVVGMYNAGVDFDWQALNDSQTCPSPLPELPKYPFRPVAYWIEPEEVTPNWQQAREFLGRRTLQAPDRVVFEQLYSVARPYKLSHHTILDRVLLSAANHICAFCEILTRETDARLLNFEELEFCEPLFIAANETYRMQYQWAAETCSMHGYATQNDKLWINVSKARVSRTAVLADMPAPTAAIAWQSSETLYTRLRASGYQYDTSFRWVSEWGHLKADTQGWQAIARITPPADLDPSQRGLMFPPGWFDSLFHVCAAITDNADSRQIYLPIVLRGLSLSTNLGNFSGTVAVREISTDSSREKTFAVGFWNENGTCILAIENLVLKRVPTNWLNHQKSAEFWSLQWLSKPRANPASPISEAWKLLVFKPDDLELFAAVTQWKNIKWQVALYSGGVPQLQVDRLVLYVDAREDRQVLRGVWDLLQHLVQDRKQVLKEIVILSPECLDAQARPSYNALLLGWKRAFNNESLTIKARLIDVALDQAGSDQWPEEILHEVSETEVILRTNDRRIPRLVSATLNDHQRPLASTVLVTGATGDIGKRLLNRLAKNGVTNIVAVSRTAVSPGVVNEMAGQGVTIHSLQTDLADLNSFRSGLNALSLNEPVREIFHCAGVLRDAAFADLSWDDFEHTLAAKVEGLLVLERLAQEHPALVDVSHWTLFSSVASLTGSMGQAHYAAANAFLDHFAHLLQQRGIAAQSLNWGPWKGTAMVNTAQRSANLREQAGLFSMEPAQAFDMLWRTPKRFTQAFCGVVDISKFGAFPGVKTPLFSEVITQQTTEKWTHFLERLNNSSAEARRELLLGALVERTRKTLELPDDMDINPHKPLQEMGLDSVMAVELRNEVTNITGKALPATLLFDYPTLSAIAEFLMGTLFPDSTTDSNKNHTEPAEPVSDEALDALLADMLED